VPLVVASVPVPLPAAPLAPVADWMPAAAVPAPAPAPAPAPRPTGSPPFYDLFCTYLI
jgi:hypothetical protein